MGIGRKATDQRTPCRKFLATPLHWIENNSFCNCQSWLCKDIYFWRNIWSFHYIYYQSI